MMDVDLLAPRLRTMLVACIGLLAALLAAVGLAGVMAYTVTQMVPEIGLRMALGAREGDVAGRVVLHSLTLTGLGLVIGTGAALWAGRLLASLLFAVPATDPTVIAAVAAFTVLLAAVASGYPALRAARVDPARVLRTL
jgi:ABC-type antimicrobial peptide transport system permease subunit